MQETCGKLCNWFAETEDYSPLPDFETFPDISPAIEGVTTEVLLEDLQLIMDCAYRPAHPGSLAHLDPPPLTSSIAADLVCAGLNNNLLAYELSPGFTKLERDLCHWIAKRIGMPESSGGILASGGTLSNLMSLVIARQHAGLQNDPSAVVLASSDAHISLLKSLGVMGLPKHSLRLVSTNDEGQISLNDINVQLAKLQQEGRKCFAVVATAGTTIRGAIDPLKRIAEFCRDKELWLHVDGAIGGVFGLVNQTASLVEGISLANSVSINPQKLLGVAKTSSILLVENCSYLKSTFGTDMPYIEPLDDDGFHGGECGIQGTRQADVLKLWLGLRQLGEQGIRFLLEESIKRRDYIENLLDSSKFEFVSGPLHLIAITPKAISDVDEIKSWSIKTRQLLLSHDFMLSRPFYKGRHYLKIVLGNPNTKLAQLEKLSELINDSID